MDAPGLRYRDIELSSRVSLAVVGKSRIISASIGGKTAGTLRTLCMNPMTALLRGQPTIM